jgi:hypothetical protein
MPVDAGPFDAAPVATPEDPPLDPIDEMPPP